MIMSKDNALPKMLYTGSDQELSRSISQIETADSSPIIYVRDADKAQALNSQDIVVGKNLTQQEIVRLVNDQGARHVVQYPNIDLVRHMNFCTQVLTSPNEFFNDPTLFLIKKGKHSLLSEVNHFFSYDLCRYKKSQVMEKFHHDMTTVSSSQRLMNSVIPVADELIMNIIYDAPKYFTMNFPHLSKENPEMNFSAATDRERILLWTEDNYGSLSTEKFIRRLNEVYSQEKSSALIEPNQGAGLGCRIIFDQCIGMFIFVRPGHKTVFCALLPLNMPAKKLHDLPKNLHIMAHVF